MSALYYFPDAAAMAAARRTCLALDHALALGAVPELEVDASEREELGKTLRKTADVLRRFEDTAVRRSTWDRRPV